MLITTPKSMVALDNGAWKLGGPAGARSETKQNKALYKIYLKLLLIAVEVDWVLCA